MGLTSGTLALVLGLAVAAALAGLLLGWRRLSRPSAGRVAARAVALFAVQTGVLALVFVLANRSLVFYSSWSDLLGSERADAAVRSAPVGRANAANTVQILGESGVSVLGRPRRRRPPGRRPDPRRALRPDCPGAALPASRRCSVGGLQPVAPLRPVGRGGPPGRGRVSPPVRLMRPDSARPPGWAGS